MCPLLISIRRYLLNKTNISNSIGIRFKAQVGRIVENAEF